LRRVHRTPHQPLRRPRRPIPGGPAAAAVPGSHRHLPNPNPRPRQPSMCPRDAARPHPAACASRFCYLDLQLPLFHAVGITTLFRALRQLGPGSRRKRHTEPTAEALAHRGEAPQGWQQLMHSQAPRQLLALTHKGLPPGHRGSHVVACRNTPTYDVRACV